MDSGFSTLWPGPESGFNDTTALQKSLFFYEAQQSGVRLPNHRIEWRGPACLADGQDIRRALRG